MNKASAMNQQPTPPKRCGSCGAPIPADFKEDQGQALPCGH